MVKATIEGNDLVIRVSLNATPVASSSGKTLVVASSHGNQKTEATFNGHPLLGQARSTFLFRTFGTQ